MTKKPLLDPNRSYTFRNYFDFGFPVDELLTEFGYSLSRAYLKLPQYHSELDRIDNLKQRIEEILPFTDLANEATRRELLISPILMDLVHYSQAQIRIEYSISVSQQLQGVLDYFFQRQQQLLVIEAKQADIIRGFTQLAVALVALDQWTDLLQPRLVGAVTTGDIWRFGVLERSTKHLTQGFNLYRVPEDLDELMRILLAALLSTDEDNFTACS